MPKRQFQISALMSVVPHSLWLVLLLLPGLSSAANAISGAGAVVETPPDTDTVPVTERAANSITRPVIADTPPIIDLPAQRKLYQQADKAYETGHYREFIRLTKALNNYPLQPYLKYKYLTHKPSVLKKQQIQHFLSENDNTVLGDAFRLTLIQHAAREHNWQSVIDLYRPGYGITTQCQYLDALINTQQSSLATQEIQKLWLSASSQPNSCDAVFEHWEKNGHKTTALIWQRFKLAIAKNNRQLANFLIKSMPANDVNIAKTWLKVHRKPQLVIDTEVLKIQHPELPNLLVHGLKKLSYRDINATIDAFQQLQQNYFTALQINQITRQIGLQMARTHMPEANIWLARVPETLADRQVREWQIRTSIRQGDWAYVLEGITLLPLDEQSDYRWQYWWAYANQQLGNDNDAQGIFQYLANKRSYYGFLAADQLNLPYAFEDRPVEPDEAVMSSVTQQPEALRARELYLLGELVPARREWHRLIKKLNTEQKLAASKLAQSWNWHDRAIITMGKTRYRDDIELRFPLLHELNVQTWSSKHNIEEAWTYAIIRRESAFISDARSSVGALGLMQLMPNTARMVARQLKIRYAGRHSLLTSNTNISLGTGYLERMLDKLNSQQVLATAAYNAGPHRVEKWLPEHYKMDAMRWIETIPFTETREYVSNVLAYMAIYEHRMDKQVTRLSQRMPPVPARNPLAFPEAPEVEVAQTNTLPTDSPSDRGAQSNPPKQATQIAGNVKNGPT